MGSMLMAALRVWPARLLLRVSEWFYPKAVPRVLQRRMDGSWLLVLANEDVGRQIVVLRRYEQRDSRAFATLLVPPTGVSMSAPMWATSRCSWRDLRSADRSWRSTQFRSIRPCFGLALN